MDYKEKYEQALENFKKIKAANKDNKELVDFIEYEYPELKESEDERIRKEITDMIYYYHGKLPCFPTPSVSLEDTLAWLEKQKSVESEDIDEVSLEYADNLPSDGEVTHDNITEPYWNFHSISKAFKDGFLKHKPFEWDEEDEKMKNLIIRTLTSMGTLNLERYHHMNLDEVKEWLKSLRPRHITYELEAPLSYDKDMNPIYPPINRWKPSEEQMKAMKFCCANFEEYDALQSLYNDLKNL